MLIVILLLVRVVAVVTIVVAVMVIVLGRPWGRTHPHQENWFPGAYSVLVMLAPLRVHLPLKCMAICGSQ